MSGTPRGAGAAGLLRRLAAITYDALLLLAVIFVATAALLPLTGGEAIAPGNPLYGGYLLLIAFLFFGWFWTHGGQTLGMRAWRLRLLAEGGGPVGWPAALARFLGAALSWAAAGLGFLWQWVDREHLAWHDRISDTRLVVLPKKPRR